MLLEDIPGTGEQYALLSYDGDGRERTDDLRSLFCTMSDRNRC